MRTLLSILVTVLVTLALILCISLGLARLEEPEVPETIPTQVIQTTAAPEITFLETTVPETTLPATQPERPSIDAIPRYYQTDYPYDRYGNGTIRTSGCGVTCLAMMATYLTDQEYLPDQLAYHFRSYGKNNIERLEYGNEQMQLPNVRTDNIQEVLSALGEGKRVIAMMGPNSYFTTTQHFIVLAGMTEDEKYLVNDPLEKTHEEDVYLNEGYTNGFEEHAIMKGFSGAWIYDKAAMPEEPFLFDASMPEEPENRYLGYQLQGNDTYELASFVWAEARDQSEEVQQAILEVLLNRVASEDFPDTVHDVIYKSELYSRTEAMARADVGMPQYRAVTAAMYGPYLLPPDVYYFSKWETSGEVWGKLGDYTFLYSRG